MDLVRRASFAALRAGAAPRVSELAETTGLDLPEIRDVFAQLVSAGIATIEGDLTADPLVVGAEGLTVRITAHQLRLGDQALHTWCAFDTVGIPAALGVDALARTICPTCGSGIELVLPSGQPPASSVVGWWPLATSGPINQSFCPTASLFCSSDHLETWRTTTTAGPGEALPLSALAERGQVTWSLFTDPGDPS